MRIGLLGGSFNPPHQGHIYISLEARKRLKLDQIWWLVNKQNPLKELKNSSFNQRLQQCQKITKKQPKIVVKADEKHLKSNYSIDLIKKISTKYKQHQFFWIIGADNMLNFHLWRQWQNIIKLTPLIILNRNHSLTKAAKSKAFFYCQKISKGSNKKCYMLKNKQYHLSSSLIRKSSKR